jgi:RimJ/RimL family protein N-acetyltransferase
MGLEPALPETRRRLDLDSAPDTSALRVDAQRHAVGYTPVAWLGPVPDEFRDDVARLGSRLVLDAPMGDLDVEPEKYDADRIQVTDEVVTLRGRRMYYAAIREDATGRLVAYTSIGFDAATTTHGWQQITIVDPAHRGHRLGILVKLANLDNVRAHEPGLRYLNTWNAQENAHMITINEALGFRAVDDWVACQYKL